jgi:predicted DNA binding protein
MTREEKYQKLVDTATSGFESQRESIASKTHWSEEARAEALSNAVESHRTQMAQLKQDYDAERGGRIRKLESKFFNPSKPTDSESEKTAKQMSYRDALSRVETALKSLNDPSEMITEFERLAAQAAETGDSILQQAVAYSAVKYGYFDQARSCLNESDQAAFDEYVNLSEALNNPHSSTLIAEQFMFAPAA